LREGACVRRRGAQPVIIPDHVSHTLDGDGECPEGADGGRGLDGGGAADGIDDELIEAREGNARIVAVVDVDTQYNLSLGREVQGDAQTKAGKEG
jgi:hypothetical protein